MIKDGDYDEIRSIWRETFSPSVNLRELSFVRDVVKMRDTLLHLLSQHQVPLMQRVIEVGPLFDPLSPALIDMGYPISQVHLSDPIYQVHGEPDVINGVETTYDAEGLPNSYMHLKQILIGGATVVLENVVNYLDFVDIEGLLTGLPVPATVIVSNDFKGALNKLHRYRMKSGYKFLHGMRDIGARELFVPYQNGSELIAVFEV